jgi:putative FmdB family regulatory protein
MPTYGYRCQDCGHEFEVFQKITDPAVSACQSCEGPVKKLLYPVGIQFKGAGFYVNDYAKSSGVPAAGDKNETVADTGGAKTPPPAEAKPDAKAETKKEAPAAPAS